VSPPKRAHTQVRPCIGAGLRARQREAARDGRPTNTGQFSSFVAVREKMIVDMGPPFERLTDSFHETGLVFGKKVG